MKKILLPLSFLGVMLLGCDNNSEGKKAEANASSQPTVDTLCFEFKLMKDVTSCQLIIEGENVRGYYDWSPYEKDGAHGILQNGVKKGDMITADWQMMIEGNVQTEEVMFKLDGFKLSKLEGELVEKGDKMIIKSPQTAVAGDILVKVDCSQIATGLENAKLAVEAMLTAKK
jgi:hypothetical protein